MTPKAHPWLSLAQAGALIGWTDPGAPRRLRRRLEAIERQTGTPILRRWGASKRTRYAVTLPALRRWCPDLFASRHDLPDAIRDAIAEVDDRIASTITRQNAHGSAIRELSRRLLAVESAHPVAAQRHPVATTPSRKG